MNSTTTPAVETPEVEAIRHQMAVLLVNRGLPVAYSRGSEKGTFTLIVGEDQVVETVQDDAHKYGGHTLHELPLSELAALVDFGTMDKDEIDDLRG